MTDFNKNNTKKTNEIPVIFSNIITKGTSTTLTAVITSITQAGLMTVTFNEAITVPSNYTTFNDTIMNVTIKPGADSDINNLVFNWTLEDFTSSQMTLQVTFLYPLLIS